MANRKQRRDTKKLMARPELKTYIDKISMDMASALIEHCEKASNEAKESGTEFKFESIEEKVKEAMMGKGEELANKVKEIANTYRTPNIKVNIR